MTERRAARAEATEQDLALISVLQHVPRITWGDAGEVLGVHPTTLAARWDRLREAGLAWISAQPDIRDTPAGLAFVELSCLPHAGAPALETLAAMPEVWSVDVFSGEPDVGLTVVTEDVHALSRLVERDLAAVPGVSAVKVLLSSRLHVPGHRWRLDVLDAAQEAHLGRIAAAEADALPPRAPLQPEHWPVVEALMRDGRASAAEIARTTGLHPATARRHLQRVLASGMLNLTCDLAQSLAGVPLTVQWFARLDAAQHGAAAARLGEDPRTRLVASVTGRSNLVVVKWLTSVADVLEAEQGMQELVPDIEIRQSVVSLRAVKRLGRILEDGGRAGPRFVVPEFPLT